MCEHTHSHNYCCCHLQCKQNPISSFWHSRPSLLNWSKSAFPYYFTPLSYTKHPCQPYAIHCHANTSYYALCHPHICATSFPLWNAPHPNTQIIPILWNAINVSSPRHAFFDQLNPYWFPFPPNSLLWNLLQEFTNLALIQNYLKCICIKK